MSNPKSKALYAVYGTLRKGFGNNRLLQNEFSKFLGTERTKAEYKMVSLGGFPGVILKGDQEITIEVWEVNSPDVEKRLDILEGFPNFYQKTELDTQWGKANMYILSEEEYGNRTVVESGDWKEFVTKK